MSTKIATMFHQPPQHSFKYNTRENLNYIYERVSLLESENRDHDAYSECEEFAEGLNELFMEITHSAKSVFAISVREKYLLLP